MKNPDLQNLKGSCSFNCYLLPLAVMWILYLTSCTEKRPSYSILEFSGIETVSNYSKSYLLSQNKSDTVHPAVIMASDGDLLFFDDWAFVFSDAIGQNKVTFSSNDSVVFLNGKIHSIILPDSNNLVPWFNNLERRDLSALQFIQFSSKISPDYLPHLNALAGIKPDVSFFFEGEFNDMAGLLRVFTPRYIVGPGLSLNDYELLSELKSIELLVVSPEDSIINEPLPPLPSLKQIFLLDLDNNDILTNDLFVNNRQIEKVVINKGGSIDFAILDPLDNLKELVVNGDKTVLNFDLLNKHAKLEVLSINGSEGIYDPGVVRLPSLRWVGISSHYTQENFDSFIETNPNLEVVEIVENDTISNLSSLSKLSKLYGLTVLDTITDIASVKTLSQLKYLSLPAGFLDDSGNWEEMQTALPNTRIVANEGFCLGSGWLLLLLPIVLIVRLFGKRKSIVEE